MQIFFASPSTIDAVLTLGPGQGGEDFGEIFRREHTQADIDAYFGRVRIWKAARNTCPNCLRRDRLERHNYDMMWGDADLCCGRCKIKIRDMDYG